MFWYNRQHPAVVYADIRRASFTLNDRTAKGGTRPLIINPDVIADFTKMPFADGEFSTVVFDPPHLLKAGDTGWLARKYGKMDASWSDTLTKGFSECWRVLRPQGVLLFKWSQKQIPFSSVKKCFPTEPLLGDRTGDTRWTFFMKV